MTNKVPWRRHSLGGALPVLLGGDVDALALDRLDDEGRHVAPSQLPLERRQVAETDLLAARAAASPKPSRNSLPPLRDSAPAVSPWNAWSQ